MLFLSSIIELTCCLPREGYVPISKEDPKYLEELAREKKEGFAPCLCSNCMEDEGKMLLQSLTKVNLSNFNDYILNKRAIDMVSDNQDNVTKRKYTSSRGNKSSKRVKEWLCPLRAILKSDFEAFFSSAWGNRVTILPHYVFDD